MPMPGDVYGYIYNPSKLQWEHPNGAIVTERELMAWFGTMDTLFRKKMEEAVLLKKIEEAVKKPEYVFEPKNLYNLSDIRTTVQYYDETSTIKVSPVYCVFKKCLRIPVVGERYCAWHLKKQGWYQLLTLNGILERKEVYYHFRYRQDICKNFKQVGLNALYLALSTDHGITTEMYPAYAVHTDRIGIIDICKDPWDLHIDWWQSDVETLASELLKDWKKDKIDQHSADCVNWAEVKEVLRRLQEG